MSISTANKVVSIALSYVGASKYGAKHKELIKAFNSVKPHGYTASTRDAWCAEAWSAWQILAGNTQKEVPMSCNCGQIIADAKKLGIWIENDGFRPSKGDAILYDWEDSGRGDNTGTPNHIGMVYDVDSTNIYVVEGNKGSSSSCGKRVIPINGRYIRGFVHPHYRGSEDIKSVTVDGYWGYMTTMLSQKIMKTYQDGIVSGQRTACKKYLPNADTTSWQFSANGGGSQLIKAIQKIIGVSDDGIMGRESVMALQKYLKAKGFYTDEVDGYMGSNTVKAWQKYLNTNPIPKPIEKSNGQKIGDKANEYAYSNNPKEAQYQSGHPKDAYKTALNKAYPNRGSWGTAARLGASCDVFVGTAVIMAGVDKNFPRGLAEQIPYLAKSAKFTLVNVNEKTVKDGDIIVYSKTSGGSHICIAYGGKIKEANHEHTYGITTNTLASRLSTKGKKWLKVYRAKY